MATQKFQLLLVDANVIIKLHELGIWESFIQSCSVTISKEVQKEARFWEDDSGGKHYFDIEEDIKNSKIIREEVSLSRIHEFCQQFDPSYFDRLDKGEAELLTILYTSSKEWQVTSADGIVFKVLGRTGRADQGISLEEILNQIGLGRKLTRQFTREFREQFTQKGQEDNVRGRGMT